MPLPKSVTKIKKDGVEFISNVDRAKYTINELTRAALRDIAKFLRKRIIEKLKTLQGMRRHRRPYNLQYWVRKKESDLVIGFKHDAWYSTEQEVGSSRMSRRGMMRDTVYENISQTRIIAGQYLSAIENENKALGLISEEEYKSPDGDE